MWGSQYLRDRGYPVRSTPRDWDPFSDPVWLWTSEYNFFVDEQLGVARNHGCCVKWSPITPMFEFHFRTELRHLFFHFFLLLLLQVWKTAFSNWWNHSMQSIWDERDNRIIFVVRSEKNVWGLGNVRHVDQAKSLCNFYLFSKIDNKWMCRPSYICWSTWTVTGLCYHRK